MHAGEIQPICYLGIEVDQLSLDSAINQFPTHSFQESLPKENEKFDTIISLAVIEHVKNSESFLAGLSKRLKPDTDARIVITTPHPSMGWVHDLGATVGLFSQHASDEYEELFDHPKLELDGKKAALRLVSYKRFIFGGNQLAVFAWKSLGV
jgi:SAM-dependent methyltransferase